MKPIIKFKKDINLDVRNWWEAANQASYGYDFSKRYPKTILKKVKNKKYSDVKGYLKKIIPSYYKTYSFCKEEFMPFLIKHENKIIKRLEKIHNRRFPVKYIEICYTSYPRCPYRVSKNKFKIIINGFKEDKDFLLKTVIHELMHLFFHKYYWETCKKNGLNEDETHDFKEAFSVLINSEFKDMGKHGDRGYDIHKGLRKFIEKEWKKSKNFSKVLEKTIEYYKKQK